MHLPVWRNTCLLPPTRVTTAASVYVLCVMRSCFARLRFLIDKTKGEHKLDTSVTSEADRMGDAGHLHLVERQRERHFYGEENSHTIGGAAILDEVNTVRHKHLERVKNSITLCYTAFVGRLLSRYHGATGCLRRTMHRFFLHFHYPYRNRFRSIKHFKSFSA